MGVIQRENQKLKDMVQQSRDSLAEVEKEFANVPCEHDFCKLVKGSLPETRVLEWRVDDVRFEAGSEPMEFKYSECPGLVLTLRTEPCRLSDHRLSDTASQMDSSESSRASRPSP